MSDTNMTRVIFALIAWVERNNRRHNYEDKKANDDARNSLATKGWYKDNTIPVIEKGIGALSPTDLNEVMESRQAKWTGYKELVEKEKSAEALAKLYVFEQLYTEPVDLTKPDGERKLIVPKYSGNAGFRRGSRTYYAAMLQRYMEKETVENPNPSHDILTLIPVRVENYSSEIERIIDQQQENEIQLVGTKKMEDLEKLQITKELFDLGATETRIRQLYVSSTGQKLFGIVQADANWPELKIYERFLIKDSNNPDFIPWGPVRHNEVGPLNARYRAQWKRDRGMQLTATERTLEPIKVTKDENGVTIYNEVDEYFRAKQRQMRGDGSNAKKIMSKDNIQAIAQNSKLEFAKEVATAVLSDSQGNLAPLMEHADSLNKAVQLVKSGKGKVVDVIMDDENDSLMADIVDLLSKGKHDELKKAVDLIKNPPKIAPVATEVELKVEPKVVHQLNSKKEDKKQVAKV